MTNEAKAVAVGFIAQKDLDDIQSGKISAAMFGEYSAGQERDIPLYPATEVERLEARIGQLEAALGPLAEACYAEFCSAKTERIEPNASKVSYPEETCHITFGMIRNARKALEESP